MAQFPVERRGRKSRPISQTYLDVGARELPVLEYVQEVRLQLSLFGIARRLGQTLEQDVSLFLREWRQPERMSTFAADKAMDRPDLQGRRGQRYIFFSQSIAVLGQEKRAASTYELLVLLRAEEQVDPRFGRANTAAQGRRSTTQKAAGRRFRRRSHGCDARASILTRSVGTSCRSESAGSSE